MNWKAPLTKLNPGKSQCQIASKYGVDQSGMGRIFRGVYQPGIGSIKSWAEKEGMAAWELVKMAEEATQNDSPA
jgi:transcriptional regulator with XRE-family HTH domain